MLNYFLLLFIDIKAKISLRNIRRGKNNFKESYISIFFYCSIFKIKLVGYRDRGSESVMYLLYNKFFSVILGELMQKFI